MKKKASIVLFVTLLIAAIIIPSYAAIDTSKITFVYPFASQYHPGIAEGGDYNVRYYEADFLGTLLWNNSSFGAMVELPASGGSAFNYGYDRIRSLGPFDVPTSWFEGINMGSNPLYGSYNCNVKSVTSIAYYVDNDDISRGEYITSALPLDGDSLTEMNYEIVSLSHDIELFFHGACFYSKTDENPIVGLNISAFGTDVSVYMRGIVYSYDENDSLVYCGEIEDTEVSSEFNSVGNAIASLTYQMQTPSDDIVFVGDVHIYIDRAFGNDPYTPIITISGSPRNVSCYDGLMETTGLNRVQRYYNALLHQPENDSGSAIIPSGTINIESNGTYNVTDYAFATINVPQENVSIEDTNMFSWLISAASGFLSFEIAPNFSIGGIMILCVGFALIMWLLKIFLGG